jgi:hypothetical protein
MYSPTAIDIAPAVIPATPAVTINLACPLPLLRSSMPAVETRPSFAPSTAARSHPARWCGVAGFFVDLFQTHV